MNNACIASKRFRGLSFKFDRKQENLCFRKEYRKTASDFSFAYSGKWKRSKLDLSHVDLHFSALGQFFEFSVLSTAEDHLRMNSLP